jgi:LysM repeat protein
VLRAIAAVFGFLLAVPSGAPNAQLTIETRTGSATSVLRVSTATLACDGTADATGFLRGVGRAACAATSDGVVANVVAAQRQARICSEQYGGPQTARISGTINGKRVAVRVARSDGCGIADWEMLRPLLGDPERRGRIPRPTRTTAPSATAPPVTYQVQRGDTLTVIARRFRTTIAAIIERNQLDDPDNLAEGQMLVIPEPSSVQLVATLLGAGNASGFELRITGVQPGEPVTFTIDHPDGSTYTGAPHIASAAGEVATTYKTSIGPGVYGVVANGDQGTGAEIRFHVDPGRG